MKFLQKSVLFCSAAALSFACQETNNGVVAPEGAISFRSNINTRATELSFETGDQIGVTAFSDAELTTIYADNVPYTFGADGVFTSTEPIVADGALTFAALYPAQTGAFANEVAFAVNTDQTTAENYELSDLLLAKTEATEEIVPTLAFNHKLSKITVAITSNVDLADAIVRVVGVKNNATLNVAEGTVAESGDATEITLGGNATDGYTAILVPQSIEANADFVTVTIGNDVYKAVLEGRGKLESGKAYQFSMVIEKDEELSFLTSDIIGWEAGDLFADDETGGGDEGGEVYPDGAAILTVADLTDADGASVSGSTISSNVWVVTDATLTEVQMSILSNSLKTATQQISLILPNLTSLDFKFLSTITKLESVSAPLLKTLPMMAFCYQTELKSLDLPSLTSSAANAIYSCAKLQEVTLCVNHEENSLTTAIFKSCTTANISLTIGSNVANVNPVNSTWGGLTFAKVVLK